MMKETGIQETVVMRRPDRGLSVAGTRITLYQIMDHILAGWSHAQIRDWFDLSEEQMQGVLAYMEANREAFEVEYQQVLAETEQRERYWRQQNQEHFEAVGSSSPKLGAEAAWLQVQARKKELGME
jgi:uncharacterized protein (DUF433 family)